MIVKIKKQNQDGIVRLESSGEIKEVLINEDFMNPEGASVHLCFKGKNSSGIIELSSGEIEFLNRKVAPKTHLLKDIKVLKFEK